MNSKILAEAVQEYLHKNQNADANDIALAKSPFECISAAQLAGQIQARKKAEKKLPTWFNTKGVYFPSPLSIEQTSSEITAAYKAKLARGASLIDLTGGFGVDAYYFSKKVAQVVHCEIDPSLSEIAKYNGGVLDTQNIEFKNKDGIEHVKTGSAVFDTIYVDPARRAEKGKVFMLKDCTPDIAGNLIELLNKTTRIIIKTAPLLDLSAGLAELQHVSQIHIVSIKNECKELLWIIDKDYTGDVEIIATTLNEHEKCLMINKSNQNTTVIFTNEFTTGDYLYEPDAALLKSGAFNFIGQHYQLKKLHPQTQLYVSKSVNDSFPGRIFRIEEMLTTTELKKRKTLKGNVIVRNYPAKAEELVKKYKIKPSALQFLIFTKISNGDNIILVGSIKQYY
ncbi:class I SAM-dependent methyltransferase [Pedobacter sp. BMA]|uniref:THUMP-like domain-containing protein n=1 Tax=Pedobacter sp. BMA TaxID=1663685 RepID=UPI00064A4FB7|nr:class I SAM-dependent methyltransferase [Pedobacter sp. BMA]KLT63665.1 hypothetical protein AB669_20615 [Pedobacter sp. BMA]